MTPDFNALDNLFLRWFPEPEWTFHEDSFDRRGLLRVDLELVEWKGAIFTWSVLYVKGACRSVVTFIPGKCVSAISRSRGPEIFRPYGENDYISDPRSEGPLLIPGTVLAHHTWPNWASKAGDFGWVDVDLHNAMATILSVEKDGVRSDVEGFVTVDQALEMKWSFGRNSTT